MGFSDTAIRSARSSSKTGVPSFSLRQLKMRYEEPQRQRSFDTHRFLVVLAPLRLVSPSGRRRLEMPLRRVSPSGRRRLKINKFYLSKIFKETYGTTINNYLISKRITRAKQLLHFTDMTVDEIGVAVGMADANYFSRMFRKVEGISPREYRKQW